ncbi:MAG: phosphoglycerate kinase [Anaerolineaceae bacterium]|nr:phosphoglycerate kinase [Anaerolineaceae bacterium]
MESGILTLDDFELRDKTVLLRVDINSPIDHRTGGLADDNRIRKSVPAIRELAEAGARTAILAHQGDTEDYRSLVSLAPHAERLAELLGRPVGFVADVCGPAAIARIRALQSGELVLLDNVRYLTEEVSTFVNYVKLTPQDMAGTWLVRGLAPLADLFVCEAIAAAHRSAPSLVGLAEALPAAGGRLFVDELKALTRIKESPAQPCVYLLGGSRIADAFSMMEQVLHQGTAHRVLTGGLTGEVMLMALGRCLGERTEGLIRDKGLEPFVARARSLLETYGERILYPSDFAVDRDGRVEIGVEELPAAELLVDIGSETVARYVAEIEQAATIFVNGPAGIYEQRASAEGTRALWTAVADAPGYSVIGGGDSVAAAGQFGVRERMGYVCTAGGGMVRFLSGQELPVVEALRRAARRQKAAEQEAGQ